MKITMKMLLFIIVAVATVVVGKGVGNARMTREVNSRTDNNNLEPTGQSDIVVNLDDGPTIRIHDSSENHHDDEEINQLIDLGYELRSGSYYKFHAQGANWLSAKRICEQEGAHLVVIDGDVEAQVVVDLFSQQTVTGTFTSDAMFIGLSDLEEEGVFRTVLGDDTRQRGYLRWRGDNPDDWRGVSAAGEDCVTMTRAKLYNDLHCDAVMSFACEFNP